MIKNERQFRITNAQAEKFRAAIRTVESAPASSTRSIPSCVKQNSTVCAASLLTWIATSVNTRICARAVDHLYASKRSRISHGRSFRHESQPV